jgi:Fe2+ or Zn2+ uptake regulation protein
MDDDNKPFQFDPETQRLLDKLREKMKGISKAETIRRALKLLKESIAKEKGRA